MADIAAPAAPASVAAPAPSAPAPASTPAPAPSAPVAPAAEKSVLQPGMTTRDAFDAVFEQKKAALEARTAAEEPEAAPAPEAPQATEKIEEKLEAQAKAKVEAPPEVPPEVAARLERTIPANVRNVLKALADPALGVPADSKTRKEIADTYYVGRAYRDAGMPLAAVPAYLEVAPTVDVLKQITNEAKVGREMLGDFMAGTPEDAHRFATRLHQSNPEAFQGLVSVVTDPGWLEKAVPDSFTSVGQHALRNLYRNAQKEATKTGNAELQAAFDIVAEWAGINPSAAPTPEEPPVQDAVQDATRAKLEAYEEQQRAYQQQQFQQFQQGTYEQAAGAVMGEVQQAIDRADPDGIFNQATRKKMSDEIGRRIYETVAGNKSIGARYQQLLQSGDGSPQHRAAVAKFLVDQGLGVLSRHAGDVLSEYGSMFEHVFNQREQKTERIMSRREPVAAGGRPAPAVDKAPDLQGVGMKNAFDAFFAHRLK